MIFLSCVAQGAFFYILSDRLFEIICVARVSFPMQRASVHGYPHASSETFFSCANSCIMSTCLQNQKIIYGDFA